MSQIITKGLLSAKLIIKGFFGKIFAPVLIETLSFTGSRTTELNSTGSQITVAIFAGERIITLETEGKIR